MYITREAWPVPRHVEDKEGKHGGLCANLTRTDGVALLVHRVKYQPLRPLTTKISTF